jgi:hypothetical protein
VEISYAFFVERNGVVGKVEREPDGSFKVFLKAK